MCLGDSGFGKVYVLPTGKAVLQVPVTQPVPQEYKFVHALHNGSPDPGEKNSIDR